MNAQHNLLYYVSAAAAVLGTVGYHSLLRRIPASVDPIISIGAIYICVLILGAVFAPLMYSGGQLSSAIRQLGWTQIGIAACILMMELGFLLMYRSGWQLSTGNIVTGVVINLALMAIGIFFIMERLTFLNVIGVLLCIVGVSMIGFRGEENVVPFDVKPTNTDR